MLTTKIGTKRVVCRGQTVHSILVVNFLFEGEVLLFAIKTLRGSTRPHCQHFLA